MAKTSHTHLFPSSPSWSSFSASHNYPLRSPPYPPPSLDIPAGREAQRISEGEWATSHPLSTIGYTSSLTTVSARDGHNIPLKISRSTRVPPTNSLPLLFVTHGGGWVQGTHITEEAWLLWPLFQSFDLVIISVDYRLVPEHSYPTFMTDCLDALINISTRADEFRFDASKIILAGSSAGALISLSLAQQARNLTPPISVKGVLATVPITSDPRHFPTSEYTYTSYEECGGALLSSGDMRAIWDLVLPDTGAGKSSVISPLLGDVNGLPMHAIFVAGQDPLRDEGLAYGEKLEREGVKVRREVYAGVPHTFGE
jgi:acetyl esterase